jgi:ABC-type dipeptide/oligopeptide/nickel transport system ATPase component
LACQPQFLIADEPTTALDVTIQAEILKLLKELQKKLGFGIIYITHNFGIIRAVCQKIMVLHKGKIVEQGPVADIMQNPKQEYTEKLINCLKELTPLPPLLLVPSEVEGKREEDRGAET